MKPYDFVLAGGGLAGLSLAHHLLYSPLRDRSVLIVDKRAPDRDDRTWGFWTRRPTPFDGIVHRTWRRLQVVGAQGAQVIDLGDYGYRVIRGRDFFRYMQDRLSAHTNVHRVQGVVRRIKDDGDVARVTFDGGTAAGRWVFDGRAGPSPVPPDPDRYHYLKLHFGGWEIETPGPAFDPGVVTFLDFRTPQRGATRFFYVLPFSTRRALVEYTLFSSALLRRREYERALRDYLVDVLGVPDYGILRQESGSIPITDQPFPRRIGRRVMTIGAQAGLVKPTTGYAFTRVQQDAAAVVQSLCRNGHPFDVPATPRRYRLYDSILLEVMSRHGDQIQAIFRTMFRNNPIDRILRFLDEVGSPAENVRLIATLPPRLFLEALLRKKVRRAVARSLWEAPGVW